jgi:cell shape-determining protein MreC
MTQQKREKERKKQEKAQRKREERALRKDKDVTEEEELTVLDGPVYFKDFDMAAIKI